MYPDQEVRRRLAKIPDPLALLTGFFECAPVALQIYTADGRCLLTNEAFRKLFGAEPPPEYNVLEDEIAAERGVLELIRRAFRGETVYVPPIWYDARELTQVEVREANRVAIEATCFPLLDDDGRATHVAIVFKDVTPEKLALERAEAERALLAAVVTQMPEAVTIVEAGSGRVLMRNERTEQLFGAELASVHELSDLVKLKAFHRDGQRFAIEDFPIVRSVRTGEQVQREEIAFEHDDGTRRVVRASSAPVRDASGSTIAGVSVLEDVTAELELMAELERAVKVRDTFLSIASHELRTPLTALSLAVHQLLRSAKRDEVEPARLIAKLGLIDRQCRRLESLIDRMLDVSRFSDGAAELARVRVNLGDLARDVVERFQVQAVAAGASIHLMVHTPVIGTWDPEHIEHVLENLLSNAIKYGAGQAVQVTVGEADGVASLVVVDHGIGIDEEDHARVFERFERVASDQHYGGFGLGLWIARQMVDGLGGTIRVSSRVGQGSTFTVELPLAPKEQ